MRMAITYDYMHLESVGRAALKAIQVKNRTEYATVLFTTSEVKTKSVREMWHTEFYVNTTVSKHIYIYMVTLSILKPFVKQELGECIPPPIRKFLAPPNRKSMG